MRSIPVLLLFGLAGLLLFGNNRGAAARSPQTPLNRYFEQLNGMESLEQPIEKDVVDSLKLDDYLSRYYKMGAGGVWVYIGYYKSPVNASAAHSPLVCFPGQGWVISDQHQREFRIAKSNRSVTGVLMTASNTDEANRVLFWYQADSSGYSNSFLQKLAVQWSMLRYGRGRNALVRFIVPIDNGKVDAADSVLENFLGVFYPAWESYLTQNS
jgi:EpsI family protein